MTAEEETLANAKQTIATAERNAAKGAEVLITVEDTSSMLAGLSCPSAAAIIMVSTARAELGSQVVASSKLAARAARMVTLLEKQAELSRSPDKGADERIRALHAELSSAIRAAKEALEEESRTAKTALAACVNMRVEIERLKKDQTRGRS